MTKIHTRMKRKKGVSSGLRHRYAFSKIKAKKGPKTFKSEEAAKTYADKHGFKDYKLVNLKSSESSTKKIRIES